LDKKMKVTVNVDLDVIMKIKKNGKKYIT